MAQHTKWVCGWASPSNRVMQNVCDLFRDMTFRYQVFSTIDASALRIHLTNQYGHEPVTINEAAAALCTGGMAVDASTSVAITFNGAPSVTLKPGEEIVSDPVDFTVSAGQTISISTYFEGLTEYFAGCSNDVTSLQKYMTHGNYTTADTFPMETYGDLGTYICFSGVDFLTGEDVSAIIAFGDSITARPWPDYLARRLYELGIRNRTVVREAINGNRVLRDYKVRIKMHWGICGIERFAHDIAQAGADRVFILHGINDIIHPGVNNPLSPMSELPTVEELIEGYKTYIRIAREQGMKVYMSPILPTTRCTVDDGIREKIRCGVNEWIRTTDLIDGVIDFEAAVWDPDDHKRLYPEYDCGDHLHPSLAGSQKMADSIPLEFVK